MPHFIVDIETHDRRLVSDLLTSDRASVGDEITIVEGATLAWQGARAYKAFGLPEEATFVLSLAAGVPVGVVGNWLYPQLKGRAASLRVDRVEVELDQGQITRILAERIEQEHR